MVLPSTSLSTITASNVEKPFRSANIKRRPCIVALKDDLLAFFTVRDDSFKIAHVDPKSVTEGDRGIRKMLIIVPNPFIAVHTPGISIGRL